MVYFYQMEEGNKSFVWDLNRESVNILKHGVDFNTALRAFKDPKRKIYIDSKHSLKEERLFCIGKVGKKIVTVRFTYRGDKIRIFGAGYWRKGRVYYEKKD
ncbi:MAG: BrnT family toxin [Candidatus Omnitrophica bacterium]|nr:BrnT family toxin [Candidatus Omnitrophota bacterium]